jgi:hypothetical protein
MRQRRPSAEEVLNDERSVGRIGHGGRVLTATLRMMHSRCESYGECLLWRGPTSDGVPRVDYAGKCRSARRVVLSLARDVPLLDIPAKLLCVVTCDNSLCLNPSHIRLLTRKQQAKRLAADGVFSNPVHNAKRMDGRRRAAPALTMELADWARESGQRGVDVAHYLGVSQQMVCLIRQGKAWAPQSEARPVASVFDLGAHALAAARKATWPVSAACEPALEAA